MNKRTLTRRQFLKVATISAVGTAVLGTGGYGYSHEIEPDWLDISTNVMTLPTLSQAFNGYRIAHLSDIHMDDWMTPARLESIVDKINAQAVDFVALTGDFVSANAEIHAKDLVRILSQLKATDGIGAVLGNHDHWTNAGVIRRVIRESGMIDLNNGVHTLTRGDSSLHIAGVDDVWEKKHRLDLVMNALPSDGAAILLAHEPDFADESSATGRFDLQLSGHSHGGQVYLPLIGAPIVPPLARNYPRGFYQVGKMIQFTVRGVGMVQPRVRFNCRPEVAILTLKAGKETGT